MTMTQVQSSNISEVGYDDVSEILFITFLSGGKWRYLGVPYDVYIELITAPSVGSHFHHYVRSKYACARC